MAEVSIAPLVIGLLGGLSIFLFGMGLMADALKAVAGEGMKTLLARLTTNRTTGAITGALVTAVIQSSSVTTVLVVGFVSAGLMSFSQSIGVIFGANVGTTITAQIVAFKVTRYALLLVAIGFGMTFFGKRERFTQQGTCVLGLGLIFFGMGVMSEAVEPLRSYPPFIDAMARMDSPIFGILAGAAFTAVVQSSSATTGVVIVLAGQGLITLQAGIGLILGANIGTCITALLASIGRPREALRAAVVHVLFNVAGVLLWVGLIGDLAAFSSWLSPKAAGAGSASAVLPRQIANAHTLFNVANTLLFLPFAAQFGRLAERLVRDRPLEQAALLRARYLDEALLDTPSLALDRARLETLRIADRVREMLRAILPAMLSGSEDSLRAVADMDDEVDILHGYVATYLGRIGQQKLTEAETRDFMQLLEAATDLENIGDIIETNLVALGLQRLRQGVSVSEPTRKVIEEFHAAVLQALDASLLVVTQRNVDAASAVVAMKRQINRMAESAALHEARRLVATEPNRLAAYSIEVDMFENLKRIYYFCKRMARALVPPDPLERGD